MKPYTGLVVVCAVTFLSRVLGQWSNVFAAGGVIFRGNDAWYHMRLASVLKANFPHYLVNDCFVNPGCHPPVGWPPMLTYLIAIPASLFNMSRYATEVYAALLPPLFAVATVVVVYFLAKHVLGNKWQALAAALLVGILPTPFFERTLLGFTDHHMLEVLLTSLALLLLLRKRYLLLGLTLGALFLSWSGAGYIVLVLTGGVAAQAIWDRWTEKLRRWDLVKYTGSVAIAGLVFLSIYSRSHTPTESVICLIIGAGVPIFLLVTSLWAPNRLGFLAGVAGVGLIAAPLIFAYIPVTQYWQAVFGRGPSDVVSEMSPLTVGLAMSHFGLALLLSFFGWALCVWRRDWLVIHVFAGIMLFATISQLRYGYYLVIPVAIFAAGLFTGMSEAVRPKYKTAVASVMLVFVLAVSASNIWSMSTFKPTTSVYAYDALRWMRSSTPRTGDFYSLDSSTPEYQVLGWWDHGSKIAYVAQRPPLTSPMGAHLSEMQKAVDEGDVASLEKVSNNLYGGDANVQYAVIEKDLNMVRPLGFTKIYENPEVVILKR